MLGVGEKFVKKAVSFLLAAHSPCILFVVLQIVFNEISAAEISRLPTLEQLTVLDEFQFASEDLEQLEEKFEGKKIGTIHRGDGATRYRYRAGEWRIYFSVEEEQILVHRVLHANTFQDFLVRSNLSEGNEDDALSKNPHFWKLIEEGEQARRV